MASSPFTIPYDGDHYEVEKVNGKFRVVRYPASPLFKPSVVHLHTLPHPLIELITRKLSSNE